MKKKWCLSGWVLVCLLSLSISSFAFQFPDHSARRLKEMMAQGDPVFLLCPLSPIVFNEKNIPGSINIPLKELRKTDKLPAEKNALIVTYCLGPK